MRKKGLALLCMLSLVAGSLTGCSGGSTANYTSEATYERDSYYGYEEEIEFQTEEYNAITESGFHSVATSPLSTFSADVDTASYSNLRRIIMDEYSVEEIPEGAVRIEELLNYFSYDYKLPKEGEPFGVTTQMGECPWNADSKLLQIGLQTEAIDFSEAPDSNLVFLIDVSGSMNESNKLGLLQRAFALLAEELTEKDRVSIVTYAGDDEIVLAGESGAETERLVDALENLYADGATNGSEGIETAYALAEEYFIEGGNNRVVLATDGDLNVGVTSESALKKLIEKKRKSGIYLSVLGFGTGNIKDNKMETLADYGNGNYSYIDSMSEAKKVLVEELGANFVTVAKDVKFQVEFNPEVVKGYRLIGYENRRLEDEDFENDKKDAGEIGAGHSVTVLYELVTVDSAMDLNAPVLKYSKQDAGDETKAAEPATENEMEETETIEKTTGRQGAWNKEKEPKTEEQTVEETESETESEAETEPQETEVETETETETAAQVNVSEIPAGAEWLTISVRYKEPDKDTSKLLSYPVDAGSYSETPSDDFYFAAAVTEFGMIVRDSEHKGSSTFDSVLKLMDQVDYGEDEYKDEFYQLVKILKRNS